MIRYYPVRVDPSGNCNCDICLHDLPVDGRLKIDDPGLTAPQVIVQTDRGDFFQVDQRVHGAFFAGTQHGLGAGRRFSSRPLAQIAAVFGSHIGLLGNAVKDHIYGHQFGSLRWDVEAAFDKIEQFTRLVAALQHLPGFQLVISIPATTALQAIAQTAPLPKIDPSLAGTSRLRISVNQIITLK